MYQKLGIHGLKIFRDHPFPQHYAIFGQKRGTAYFEKLSLSSKTLHMNSEGFGEIFEGDFADTCACVNGGMSKEIYL